MIILDDFFFNLFLIVALKRRLWVLIRTASLIYVLSKIRKISLFFHVKIDNFYSFKNCSILNRLVNVMC